MTGSTRRALVFAPYGNLGINFATSLELAQRYLDDGWHVTLLRCEGILDACDMKHRGTLPLSCRTCAAAQRRGPSLLDGDVDELVLPRADARVDHALSGLPDRIRSVDELLALRYERFDLGEAVFSSTASVWWLDTVEPDFDDDRVQDDIRAQVRSAIAVYIAVLDVLGSVQPDEMAVFNGRMAIMRACIRACEAVGTPYWTHDRGGDTARFLRVRNGMRHELAVIAADIDATCARTDAAERERVATAFYADRERGTVHAWRSHTSLQIRGLVPDADGALVAAFTSTDTEFVGLGPEWRETLYPSQVEGIDRIAAALAEHGWSGRLVVRVHPNTTSPAAVAAFAALADRHPHVTVLPPTDPVDSYALADAADRVVVFGTTMGIESAYRGRHVVLAAPAAYRGRGAVHEPATHDELVAMLIGEDLPELSRQGAIDFGFWLRTFGEPFRYAAEPELGFATFRGRRVDPAGLRLLRRGREQARRARRALRRR